MAICLQNLGWLNLRPPRGEISLKSPRGGLYDPRGGTQSICIPIEYSFANSITNCWFSKNYNWYCIEKRNCNFNGIREKSYTFNFNIKKLQLLLSLKNTEYINKIHYKHTRTILFLTVPHINGVDIQGLEKALRLRFNGIVSIDISI